jgi:AraC-like DNA-binding protein
MLLAHRRVIDLEQTEYMPTSSLRNTRSLLPEFETVHGRTTEQGYESLEEVGLVRCLEHGYPTPLARWHFHEEYELHLIVATSGNAFVGDWVGVFEPGHLVLCGPRLPHNWVSLDAPDGGIARRDLVIQFLPDPIFEAAEKIPEFVEAVRMLERARHGIEFFGMSELAEKHWQLIRDARGLLRFSLFCAFLADLSRCTDYRLLSGVQLEGDSDMEAISEIVNRIAADPSQPASAAKFAAGLGMNTGRFGRLFRRCTGNSFVGYVNQVRIHSACQLLMQTDRYVTTVCYEVGFNNLANFNRQFLEIRGMTPSEFRKQSRLRFSNGSPASQ